MKSFCPLASIQPAYTYPYPNPVGCAPQLGFTSMVPEYNPATRTVGMRTHTEWRTVALDHTWMRTFEASQEQLQVRVSGWAVPLVPLGGVCKDF